MKDVTIFEGTTSVPTAPSHVRGQRNFSRGMADLEISKASQFFGMGVIGMGVKHKHKNSQVRSLHADHVHRVRDAQATRCDTHPLLHVRESASSELGHLHSIAALSSTLSHLSGGGT